MSPPCLRRGRRCAVIVLPFEYSDPSPADEQWVHVELLEKRQTPPNPIIPPIIGPPGPGPVAPVTPVSPAPAPSPSTAPSSVAPNPPPIIATTANITTISTTVTQSNLPHVTTTQTKPRTSTTSTTTPTATKGPVEEPESTGTGASIVVAAATIGGLVFAIGVGITAFKCIASRKDRQRRQKEIAAALADSFDRSNGQDKYHELGDGSGSHTPVPAGAQLSRQGSQDAYYQKEGGSDYYGGSGAYVQERYGAPVRGGYDETEMSVMGSGPLPPRATSPYMGQQPSTGHYGGGGYNDYDYGNSGYNGHQQGGGYGYGQRY
ncbi:hypothetical protein BGZ94_005913 [Podila epigama]|nr:hypothetical protein BGZ94_005913 [Podila epigama]